MMLHQLRPAESASAASFTAQDLGQGDSTTTDVDGSIIFQMGICSKHARLV